jgi:fatty-acyl-CoA synthase
MWQLPDDVVLAEAIPLTATGKIDKKRLREQYRDHLMKANAG